jgi:hypothetical protein
MTMMEPRKLLDDAPDEVTASLLRSATDDQPSARAFSRTALALGVSSLVPLATSAAAAGSATGTAAKLIGALGLKWFGLGAVAGLILAGGASLTLREEPAASVSATRPPATVPVAATATTQNRQDVPVVTPPPASTAPAQRASPEREPIASGKSKQPEPPAALKTPTIAREIAMLDGARAALRRNDPGAALAAVDALERNGTVALGPEVTVIRVQALLARGETARATALARRFLAENPASPHANRMRDIIRTHP